MEHTPYNSRAQWALMLAVALTVVMVIPSQAYALDIALCNVIAALTGNTGRLLATLAIITIGLAAMFAKVSWGMAIIVATGISVLFGAADIVLTITGAAPAC